MHDCNASCPVHFTQVAPVPISSGELVLYDVVNTKTGSRRSFLACIAEAGGNARLPEAVNASEFRAWLAAGAGSKDMKRTPFSTLCTIVKVYICLTATI